MAVEVERERDTCFERTGLERRACYDALFAQFMRLASESDSYKVLLDIDAWRFRR